MPRSVCSISWHSTTSLLQKTENIKCCKTKEWKKKRKVCACAPTDFTIFNLNIIDQAEAAWYIPACRMRIAMIQWIVHVNTLYSHWCLSGVLAIVDFDIFIRTRTLVLSYLRLKAALSRLRFKWFFFHRTKWFSTPRPSRCRILIVFFSCCFLRVLPLLVVRLASSTPSHLWIRIRH